MLRKRRQRRGDVKMKVGIGVMQPQAKGKADSRN